MKPLKQLYTCVLVFWEVILSGAVTQRPWSPQARRSTVQGLQHLIHSHPWSLAVTTERMTDSCLRISGSVLHHKGRAAQRYKEVLNPTEVLKWYSVLKKILNNTASQCEEAQLWSTHSLTITVWLVCQPRWWRSPNFKQEKNWGQFDFEMRCYSDWAGK